MTYLIQVYFNLRPHAIEFLVNMAQIFELVLFTAADSEYASAFFDYLNMRSDNAMSQFLSREHCINVYKTLFVKDLRIITNRHLKDMVLLDNSTHNFGGLMENGIPICTYIDDNRDLELLYMETYLRSLSQADDVR
jgi:CTD small phosphatase-like protein 2